MRPEHVAPITAALAQLRADGESHQVLENVERTLMAASRATNGATTVVEFLALELTVELPGDGAGRRVLRV